MSEPVATLISSTGDSVTVHGPGGADTVLPVAVWQLPDARRVVVVGEGGPLIVADIDGAQLAEAIQSRWPGATMLERRARAITPTGDPRAYGPTTRPIGNSRWTFPVRSGLRGTERGRSPPGTRVTIRRWCPRRIRR